METVVSYNNYSYNGQNRNHFSKPSDDSSQTNILCHNCTENQQKIVQLLNSFEANDKFPVDHRKQYEIYASKLESRYPLCATCTYRVSVQLKRCEEDASLNERRQNALGGNDWTNKIKLAEKMKWTQRLRRIIKGAFFWPDFLFQLYFISKIIVFRKNNFSHNYYNDFYTILSFNNLSIWLPSTFSLPASFHLLSSFLFSLQIIGIFSNHYNPLEAVPQIFLLIGRVFMGNFLFRFEDPLIDLNGILTLAAVGLAIIFKTGSRNSLISRRSSLANRRRNPSDIIFSKNAPDSVANNSLPASSLNSNRKTRAIDIDKNGFAIYSENHHKFHSFANIVGENQQKPIMPWPDKPLPGKLHPRQKSSTFDENLLSNFNNSKAVHNFKMKPTKLNPGDDPLELEPMFSSFSLSDEPRNRRLPSVKSSSFNYNNTDNQSIVDATKKNNFQFSQPLKLIPQNINVYNPAYLKQFGNALLTSILAICRIYLMKQIPLVSVILALTFGLRGFIWPRLPLKYQLITLTVALGRLTWLGAILNGNVGDKFGYFSLAIDLILIILR